MELFYRDKFGYEWPWLELDEGIYEVRKINQGQQMTFIHKSDLPEAMNVSQFSVFKQAIAEKLSFRMFDPVSSKNEPISVNAIFEVIDRVIKTGVTNHENKPVASELEMY